MSDNLRRYRAIHQALKQGYPGEPSGRLARTRSGCQNIKLAIASYDGVPCRNGHTSSLTLRHLGTDTPRSTGLYAGS